MIQLDNDSLRFTFPDIDRQVRAMVEQYLVEIRPKFRLPDDRSVLVDALIAQIYKEDDLRRR